MKNTDPRVDAYIENAPEFAQPILEKLRKAFHVGEPNIEETMKWRVPHFDHNGMVGGFAAFKKHVGFGFWKAEVMDDPAGLFDDIRKKSPMSIKITDAKRDATRTKRLAQAIEWMAEGKSRNSKYTNC